ncbi:hypothetical protein B0H16DRAFT_1742044 [Mycena metata]|uniref:Uncharacterized protein n=1 Tax=Mycena metata TaxID=1033252 RepID=A0AAD7H9I8_9AGAR|nr:hypothetical protein B0H16DRAFT_1742044 [Mycena metata]
MTPKYVAELKKKPKPSGPEAFLRKLVPSPSQQYGRQRVVACQYKREHKLRVNMGAQSDEHLGDWEDGCHPSKDDDSNKSCAPKFPPSSSPITPADRRQWRAALEDYKPREAKLKSLLYHLQLSVHGLVDIQSLKTSTAPMPSATATNFSEAQFVLLETADHVPEKQIAKARTLMDQLDSSDVPIWTINSVPKRNNKAHNPIAESDSDSDDSDAPVVPKRTGKAAVQPNKRGSQSQRMPSKKAKSPIPESDSDSDESDAPVVGKGKGKAPAKPNKSIRVESSDESEGHTLPPSSQPGLGDLIFPICADGEEFVTEKERVMMITVFSFRDLPALKTHIHAPKETYMNLAEYPLNLEYPVEEYMLFSPRSGGYNSVEGPVNLVGRGNILVYRHSSLTVEDCPGIDALEAEARQARIQEVDAVVVSQPASFDPRTGQRRSIYFPEAAGYRACVWPDEEAQEVLNETERGFWTRSACS